MDNLSKCLQCFPILDSLMSYLSATDSAILLGVTGLLYHEDRYRYSRYINIYKDMPEYANWIQNMISKGHTILLVGKDLEEIQHSYKYPLTYWKNHSRAELRSLWLVALATKMYKDSVGDPDFLVATDENGDVFELPRTTETYLRHFHWGGGCENILCYPSSLSMSYNLPPPLSWTDCAYDMMKKRSWCTLPRTMDSDISLVYLPNYCRDEVLFDESTEASEPYFSAIFGSADPFYEPTNVPYIQMVDGERKLGMTELWVDDAIELPLESEFLGHELTVDSDMDTFIFAFYRHIETPRGSTGGHRYVLMGLEFTGLDPDERMS